MSFELKEQGEFKYVDSSNESNEPLLLLHGLFGELSNFGGIYNYFKNTYRILIPVLPLTEVPLRKIGLSAIVEYVENFVQELNLRKINLLGNSLGGHIAQLFTLRHPERIKSLILTGSSGLFENSFGGSFLRRNDYEYIKQKAQMTFYDPAVATKEMIDVVFGAVNDRNKAIRLVGIAKSAIKHNLEDKLHMIEAPSLLIWGRNDTITPPFVAEKFKDLLPNSKLRFIDQCGHAPMMEKPEEFNSHLAKFLSDLKKKELAYI